MKQDDRKIEEGDIFEEFEMIPLEPMMFGYSEMNTIPGMDFNQSYDDAMGFRQNINPNTDMYQTQPNMDMETNIGMNQWMETNEFNDNMYMDEFSPMDMTYGDLYMEDSQGSNEIKNKQSDVDSIMQRIESYNPLVFRQLSRGVMPYEETKATIRKVVNLTLMYSEE